MRSSKRILKTGIMIAVLVCILLLLDFALYPCTFMRNDVHAVANNTYDDVYMGTSHGKMNIDPSVVLADSGRTGHNICVGGEYSIDTYYMIKMMVERGHKPARIVYELSPGYYVREKEEGNNYLLFYHEFPMGMAKLAYFADAVAKCNFRTLFFPWYEYQLSYELEHLQETVSKKLNRDYSADGFATETQEYHEDGFIERYPVDPSEFDWDTMEEIYPEDLVQENIDYLRKIIEYCQEQGIEFVSIVTPMQDDVLAEFSEGYEALDEYFAELMAEYDVPYINFNTDPYYGLTAHDPESFTDLDGHMNGDAAREFSLTLLQVLNGSGEIPEDDPEAEEYEEEPDVEEEPELLG